MARNQFEILSHSEEKELTVLCFSQSFREECRIAIFKQSTKVSFQVSFTDHDRIVMTLNVL